MTSNLKEFLIQVISTLPFVFIIMMISNGCVLTIAVIDKFLFPDALVIPLAITASGFIVSVIMGTLFIYVNTLKFLER
jgi:hypothetical protein